MDINSLLGAAVGILLLALTVQSVRLARAERYIRTLEYELDLMTKSKEMDERELKSLRRGK